MRNSVCCIYAVLMFVSVLSRLIVANPGGSLHPHYRIRHFLQLPPVIEEIFSVQVMAANLGSGAVGSSEQFNEIISSFEETASLSDQQPGPGASSTTRLSASEPPARVPGVDNTTMTPREEASLGYSVHEELKVPESDMSVMDVPQDATPPSNMTAGTDDGAVQEDIPSFSEWTQKQLAEAEKKRDVNSSMSSSSGNLKLRSKNQASPDCGAKVLISNPESGSAGSVLSPSQDEYMLNTCTSRIWFIVELCEAIQAKKAKKVRAYVNCGAVRGYTGQECKIMLIVELCEAIQANKIELANFELFSSSPREFSVFVSDRYPTRDWQLAGQFTASDERTVQSFTLPPGDMFSKYIKVELHSHYGQEHFCPVSLFRAYGTSEFEALDTEDENEPRTHDDNDDDDEEPLYKSETGEPPRNLFGSARDAVLSIVKKAAEALVKGGEKGNGTSTTALGGAEHPLLDTEWCISPSHLVVCDNCSDALYHRMFQLLACQGPRLARLLDQPLVAEALHRGQLCGHFGLDLGHGPLGAPYPLRPLTNGVIPKQGGLGSYLEVMLSPEYLGALCNTLAVLERKVVLNVSQADSEPVYPNKTTEVDVDKNPLLKSMVMTCTMDLSSKTEPCDSPRYTSDDIQPTRTQPDKMADLSSDVQLEREITTEVQLSEETTRVEFRGSKPAFAWRDSGKPFRKKKPSSPDRDLNLYLPVLAGLAKHDWRMSASSSTVLVRNHTVSQLEEPERVLEATPEEEDLDTLLSELKELNIDSSTIPASVSTTSAPPSNIGGQKESVFLRLSNRIKGVEGASSRTCYLVRSGEKVFKNMSSRTCRSVEGGGNVFKDMSLGRGWRECLQGHVVQYGALERNMSLSGQYLEELSRRYKRQVEEMQRSLNRSLVAAAEDSRREEERDRKRAEEEAELREQLEILTVQVKSLMAERTSWPNIFSVFLQCMLYWEYQVSYISTGVLAVCVILPVSGVLYLYRCSGSVFLQHVVFLSIEVAVVLLVLQFLRQPQRVMLSSDKHVIRRTRSLDGVGGHLSRSHDCRRTPSGQVTVSDTHNHLMLPDMDLGEAGIAPSRAEGKRRRRKRRDPVKSASINTPVPSRRVSDHSRAYQAAISGALPSRRASSSDLVQACSGEWLSPLKDQYSTQPMVDIQLPRVQLDFLLSSAGVEDNHLEISNPHFVPASKITTGTSPLQDR
uniref:SUN domain-containing protein n=1 Tax=Timema bartmani TaxID=61472 RepID=A0A7R9I532_9NEOP|nr:unnamed protein product [Timema bartmani]